MTDLRDGESVEMQGSASRPYVLKNVAGVYSCSCPAWRNQSLPIERRTCKHLRKMRGDAAEEARLGAALSSAAKPPAEHVEAPALLLAESWNEAIDPAGWLFSEKLDGVRAYWTGEGFVSRNGNAYVAPEWFTAGLPREPLDGELWLGRKQFQRTVSIVRRHDQSDLWREVRFLIFDAPAHDGSFTARLKIVEKLIRKNRPAFAAAHPHAVCRGRAHLLEELERVLSLGGEGVMLRQPDAKHETGRSSTLLKVKRFHDAEARVVAHEPGAGRHKGRLGALLVELADGTRFAVGTGLSDAERVNPPVVGSLITFRYQELTDGGVPRFPTFVGIAAIHHESKEGESTMSSKTASKSRRFEFVEGKSSKFWEVEVRGGEVIVRFGRIGTHGQSVTKSFVDSSGAAKHAEKLVGEKTRKGYVEVS